MTDSNKLGRFYAIGAIGWGRGHTTHEAKENYVATQLNNWPSNVYVTEEALRDGELAPQLWHAPEGTEGFTVGYEGLHWELENGDYVEAEESHQVEIGTEQQPGCAPD